MSSDEFHEEEEEEEEGGPGTSMQTAATKENCGDSVSLVKQGGVEWVTGPNPVPFTMISSTPRRE
jgi:hypothetical protein